MAYNQPKLCPNASWNPEAATFANSSIVGNHVRTIFINKDDAVFVGNRETKVISFWRNGSVDSTIAINTSACMLDGFAVAHDNTVWTQELMSTSSHFKHWTINGTLINSSVVPYLQSKFAQRPSLHGSFSEQSVDHSPYDEE
jgi:hypothetical protein